MILGDLNKKGTTTTSSKVSHALKGSPSSKLLTQAIDYTASGKENRKHDLNRVPSGILEREEA
jgi:hypothetical protein